MKPFDLLFYKGNSIVSKVIKYFTGSTYSHVGLVLDGLHIVEIDWKFPLKIRHLKYNSRNYDIYRIDNLNEKQKEKMLEFVNFKLNTEYDHWENIRFLLWKFFKIKTKDDIDKFNCIEFIVDCFKYAGISLSDKDIVSFDDLINSGMLIKIE
jgi:uncharacterized protein YycO